MRVFNAGIISKCLFLQADTVYSGRDSHRESPELGRPSSLSSPLVPALAARTSPWAGCPAPWNKILEGTSQALGFSQSSPSDSNVQPCLKNFCLAQPLGYGWGNWGPDEFMKAGVSKHCKRHLLNIVSFVGHLVSFGITQLALVWKQSQTMLTRMGVAVCQWNYKNTWLADWAHRL